MKVHANAPLGPKGREIMVLRVLEQGWSLTAAAEAAGVSERTCSKWVGRYRGEGPAGLLDRSSVPHEIPHRTPEETVQAIVVLRKVRMTAAEISYCLGVALSTVSAVLLRVGLGKLSRLEPPEPPNRYERRHPGDGALGHASAWEQVGVLSAGIVTAVPLLLFASGARRLPLTTLGLLQYLVPSLNFLLGAFLYREPLTPARLVSFGFIWAALALYSLEMWRQAKA